MMLHFRRLLPCPKLCWEVVSSPLFFGFLVGLTLRLGLTPSTETMGLRVSGESGSGLPRAWLGSKGGLRVLEKGAEGLLETKQEGVFIRPRFLKDELNISKKLLT